MLVFWLTGCVFVWNQNFGSDIHTNKMADDTDITQKYEADVKTGNNRR